MRHFPHHCPDLCFGLDRGYVSSLLCFDEMYIGMLECWMLDVDVLNIESWINQSSTSKERKSRTEQCNDQ